METNVLTIILVSSFSFVSVSLGVRWAIESVIDYKMAQYGMRMLREEQPDIFEIEVDDDDEFR
jgi:hypothetical protein